jgi:hypothetical protein
MRHPSWKALGCSAGLSPGILASVLYPTLAAAGQGSGPPPKNVGISGISETANSGLTSLAIEFVQIQGRVAGISGIV